MDSARQRAVLTHMSAKSAQQGIISANAQSLDKITSHCHRPLNKALTLPQTHRSQLESSDSIVTPINVQQLQNYLSGYDQATSDFLIEGFSQGFKIPYIGERRFRLSRNLSSLIGKAEILRNKIEQEIEAKRVSGPFLSPPFPNFQVSPLGLVPKKAPNDFRLIHHLSYPEGDSINSHIPKEMTTVSYQSIDTAVALIKQVGQGALLAKTDLENAYKQIPIHPTDFELLGFKISDSYYYDKTLPFGLSYSCHLFEQFSSALQWILEEKFKVGYCVHVLDDFLFVGSPRSPDCYSSLLAFYSLAKDINLPIKSEKTVYPTTTLTFLGLELDTLKFEIRLPTDKLERLKSEIKAFQNKRTATLRQLQSLIGTLNYACAVVPPGRTFLRRIINLTRGLQNPFHHRNLDKEARADLNAWAIFLDHFNGKGFFPSGIEHTSSSLHLFTDASNLGFGCTFGRKWFYAPFSLSWLDFHISVREFLPIVIAFEIWGHLLSNSTVVLHVDNIAVVHVINKNSSRDPSLMQLMRRLMVLSLTHNIHFRAKHIEGVNNIAADLLSRLQVKEFQARFPYMDPACTPVSPALISL